MPVCLVAAGILLVEQPFNQINLQISEFRNVEISRSSILTPERNDLKFEAAST
jgi:hypothetical protein